MATHTQFVGTFYGSSPEGFINVQLPANKNMFAESCTRALNHLKAECYSLQLQQHIKLLDNLIDQLSNGFITVSFIGEYNSGKSTLINALLGNSYLHEDFKAATINQVYIEHDSNVHFNSSCEKNKVTCENCPKLAHFPPKADGLFLAIGQSNILEQIKRSNSVHRRTGQCSQTVMENYLLKVNSPFLENISKRSKMKVYLVDNPGFGETNRQAERTAQVAMANSSIYVVCMDYEHTEGTKQREFICHFLTKYDDELCFTRLLIAITKCDRLSDQEDSTDICSSLKQSVCEELNAFIRSPDGIEDVPGGQTKSVVTIPIANVIPVSAQYEKQAARYGVTALKESHLLTNMSLDENCEKTKMKALSNVQRLKDMIQHAVDRSYECWVNQMKQGVTEMLSCASKTLLHVIEDTENELRRVTSEAENLSTIRSSFYVQFDIKPHKEKFRSAYDEDIKVTLSALCAQLDNFCATSLEKANRNKYKKGEFKEDVNIFLEAFSTLANILMDTVSFKAMYARYTEACCAVQQWYTQRTNAANHFCTGSVSTMDDAGPSEKEYQITLQMGTVRDAPNFVELKDQLDIFPIELSWLEKIQEYFRKNFPNIFNAEGMPLEYNHLLKSAHVEAFVEDLRSLVMCKCAENDKIVQHFCGSLKMVYESKEQQLHTLWGDRVKEKEKHLEKLENEKCSLQVKLQQLKLCFDKIEAYKEDVESKAKNALAIRF